MLSILNDCLKELGVKEKEKRAKICEYFGFQFGVFQDQYWFKDASGTKAYPCIAFSSNGPAADAEEDGLGTVWLPSGSFSWHEYLHGNMEYLFDEIGEDLSKIDTGDDEEEEEGE